MGRGIHFLIIAMLAWPLAGQVVARQATPAELPYQEFTSPMVIELPLDTLKEDVPGDSYLFTDQDKFICDDVLIKLITLHKTLENKGTRVALGIRSSVFVRPSHDRKVTLTYTLVKGGKPVSDAMTQVIAAKEGKFRAQTSELAVARDLFDSLVQGEGKGVLRIVMTVASDK